MSTDWDETMYEQHHESLLKDHTGSMLNPDDILTDDDDDFQEAQINVYNNMFIHEHPELYYESIVEPCEEEMPDEKEQEMAFVLPTNSRACRHRYISEYKQNKLCCATDIDRDLIAQCSISRCWANCKLDAELYTTAEGDGARTDVEVYICLYGVHPSIVERIDYPPTIAALNHYATVIASEDHIVTPIFYRRFREFINALEESGYVSGYTDRQSSGLYRAYSRFVDALETETRGVDEELLE